MSRPLLLDASVWLAALDRDDDSHSAVRALLEAAADEAATLAALDLTLYEIANVAVVRWRSPSDANRLVQLVRLACPDTIERADAELLERAAEIAAEYEITVYAASRRCGRTLVSADLADLVTPSLAVSPDDPATPE